VPVVERPRSAASPQWSPDGGSLAFAATLPARPGRQVYSIPAAGGEPTPLTTSRNGVIAYAWSPDGRSIAFTEAVAEPEGAADRRARGDDVIVWSEQGRFVRLWVQPLGAEPRAVTPENGTSPTSSGRPTAPPWWSRRRTSWAPTPT
jgi:Tol biopolymer transport system component